MPLSAAALDLLKAQRGSTEGDFVFPGARRGKPLSNMAMLKLMERMGRGISHRMDFAAHFAIGQASRPRTRVK